MDSGSFDVNETVEGFDGATRVFAARTCAPNHKTEVLVLLLQLIQQIHITKIDNTKFIFIIIYSFKY